MGTVYVPLHRLIEDLDRDAIKLGQVLCEDHPFTADEEHQLRKGFVLSASFMSSLRCCRACWDESFRFVKSKFFPQFVPQQQEVYAHLKHDRPHRQITEKPHLKHDRPHRQIPEIPNLESWCPRDEQRR